MKNDAFRRCESRLDSASFKVGAGHNFCIFLLVAQATNQQIAVVAGLASAFVLGDQGRL